MVNAIEFKERLCPLTKCRFYAHENVLMDLCLSVICPLTAKKVNVSVRRLVSFPSVTISMKLTCIKKTSSFLPWVAVVINS